MCKDKIMSEEEYRQKLAMFAKPVDIDGYIEKGLLAHYKNTKSKFIVLCDSKELPEDINLRTNRLEIQTLKDGSSQLVITVDLRVHK